MLRVYTNQLLEVYRQHCSKMWKRACISCDRLWPVAIIIHEHDNSLYLVIHAALGAYIYSMKMNANKRVLGFNLYSVYGWDLWIKKKTSVLVMMIILFIKVTAIIAKPLVPKCLRPYRV